MPDASLFGWMISPRYVPGGPAARARRGSARFRSLHKESLVGEPAARVTAAAEARAYLLAKAGALGPEMREKAEREGLALIVYSMSTTGRPGGFEIYDALTGERWYWPNYAPCKECGVRKVPCKNGRLREHGEFFAFAGCKQHGEFVGEKLEPGEPMSGVAAILGAGTK